MFGGLRKTGYIRIVKSVTCKYSPFRLTTFCWICIPVMYHINSSPQKLIAFLPTFIHIYKKTIYHRTSNLGYNATNTEPGYPCRLRGQTSRQKLQYKYYNFIIFTSYIIFRRYQSNPRHSLISRASSSCVELGSPTTPAGLFKNALRQEACV